MAKMTKTEQETARLTHAANRFYQEAEAPDANAWHKVFTALAKRDLKALYALCEEHGVLTHKD